MREKRLSEITLPQHLALFDFETDDQIWMYHFRVMGGCLSIFVGSHVDEYELPTVYQMWNMKEYRVHSSWTKSFVFSTCYHHSLCFFRPIYFTKNGQILGLTNYNITLLRLNDKGGLFEHHGKRSGLIFNVCI